MPILEIICLANSKKHSGRCVAGIRTDGKGWIRPVSIAPEGVLEERHYVIKNIGPVAPLQVVRIPFDKPRPLLHHPEDWLIRPDSWEQSAPELSQEQITLLKQALTEGPELLGNTADRVPYPPIGAPPLDASLALVQPENLRIVVKEGKKPGDRRLRVNFDLAGTAYNLALTDVHWEEVLKEKPFGDYSTADLDYDPEALFLLTISLSEPFQATTGVNHCYKLVAGIFEAPHAWAATAQQTEPLAPPEPPPVIEATKGRAAKRKTQVLEPEPTPEPETQPESASSIRVAVVGAVGRMGREVIRAVHEAPGLELVAAIDTQKEGQDAGELAGIGTLNVSIQTDLQFALEWSGAEVLVDFTLPDSVFANILIALEMGVAPVVGTTGLSTEQLEEIDSLARDKGLGVFVAPNFAIGAVLMMEFAAQAAKYMPDVEIIELHHEKKIDSPSGTAILTAQKIAQARATAPTSLPHNPIEKVPGARGATLGEVPIHSVRLQGFVASQEVIFGGLGQTLTLRHDSQDRSSFMPGVVLAAQRVRQLEGLVIGLEKLLF